MLKWDDSRNECDLSVLFVRVIVVVSPSNEGNRVRRSDWIVTLIWFSCLLTSHIFHCHSVYFRAVMREGEGWSLLNISEVLLLIFVYRERKRGRESSEISYLPRYSYSSSNAFNSYIFYLISNTFMNVFL